MDSATELMSSDVVVNVFAAASTAVRETPSHSAVTCLTTATAACAVSVT